MLIAVMLRVVMLTFIILRHIALNKLVRLTMLNI
jgi:hypothetical protein